MRAAPSLVCMRPQLSQWKVQGKMISAPGLWVHVMISIDISIERLQSVYRFMN